MRSCSSFVGASQIKTSYRCCPINSLTAQVPTAMRRSECFLMRSENFKEEARTMEKTILKAMQVIVCALGAIIGLLFLIFIKIWKQVKWQSIHLPGQLRGGDSDHEREVRRNGEVFSWKCDYWFSVRASQAEDNPGIRWVYPEDTFLWFKRT